MSTWTNLGGRKLEEIVNKAVSHLKSIKTEVGLLQKMVESLSEKGIVDVGKFFEEINKYEHEADRIKRDVMKELRMGYLHPLDREDILRLVMEADDIAAYTKATARRLMILYNLGFSIPEDVMGFLQSIVDKTYESIRQLHNALKSLTESVDKTLSYIEEVEKLEEEIDEERMKALESLYKKCIDKIDAKCILVKEIIDDAENISDKCEDTGDVLRIIAVSLM